jgi:hypothetical protein
MAFSRKGNHAQDGPFLPHLNFTTAHPFHFNSSPSYTILHAFLFSPRTPSYRSVSPCVNLHIPVSCPNLPATLPSIESFPVSISFTMARNIKKRTQKPKADKNLPGTPRLAPPSSTSQYAQPLASEIVVDQEQSLELVKTVISAAVRSVPGYCDT